MAARLTVQQHSNLDNFIPIRPEHGVITLFGFGINVRVDRGHLSVRDGIGAIRREARFSRVRHGLRRVVVIGSDGVVSLGALRWLADQNASLVMLERNGSVLAVTGPVSPTDARLRRAQALIQRTDAGLQIAKELIRRKLEGQERLARKQLNAESVAKAIAGYSAALENAQSLEAIRVLESNAGLAYWSAWRTLPIKFPRNDLRRTPEHWQTFGTRISPLTRSPRLAVNPPNAILNYLYAVLESEARLAIATLGFDPGLGILHFDSRTRDSLACDLMETVRPEVDTYLFDWLAREPLRREWFFEERDGNCRLMGSFARKLSETAPTWTRMLAPQAEWLSRCLSSGIRMSAWRRGPATRLTGTHRRQARGIEIGFHTKHVPQPPRVCQKCGIEIRRPNVSCRSCAAIFNTQGLVQAAKQGRIAAQTHLAQRRRAETQSRHAAAKRAWKPTDNPSWLNMETYLTKVRPLLINIKPSKLAAILAVSLSYAIAIRSGERVPHLRHWLTLAELVGVLE